MSKSNVLAEFPIKVPRTTGPADDCYVKVGDRYAIHGEVPPALAPSIVCTLEEGKIAVCRGTPDLSLLDSHNAIVTPVYVLNHQESPAVPTGLVFVRFSENVAVQERRTELARVGYAITEIVSYAPHAAWLRAIEGGILGALNRLSALAVVPDVVNVEPQMIMERRHR